jgi:predicted transcriptional regulator
VAPGSNPNRINVTLDDEHAEKLRRLAERTHVNEGTIARSLLTTALDDADPQPRNVTELLDRVPGALDRAEAGLAEVRAGRGKPLNEL